MARLGVKAVFNGKLKQNGSNGKVQDPGNGHVHDADDQDWMEVAPKPSDWHEGRDLVHDPTRLRVMATILREGGAGFQDLRIRLGLDDQEIATQTKILDHEGLLETQRKVGGTGLVVTFEATQAGRETMAAYCEWMRDILEGLPVEAPADV